MNNLENFVSYDHLLYGPMKDLGWHVESVSWRDRHVCWDRYDAVVIRSPWDYQDDPERFMEVLEEIDTLSHLENSIELVRWNISKTYLRDLEERGIGIVPTFWPDKFRAEEMPEYFDAFDADEIVIKPVIGANADDTYRISPGTLDRLVPALEQTFGKSGKRFLVQPFISRIVDEGEFSVFFFGDRYSHTILKTPKDKDFRVQEEHGGRLSTVEPDQKLLTVSRQTMKEIRPAPLYARLDFVRITPERFALMELELIEPSLYFNMDPQSPILFARVFDDRMKQHSAAN